MADDFVTWIPNNIKSSIIGVPPVGTGMSGAFVADTTEMKGRFQRIPAQFAKGKDGNVKDADLDCA